MQVPVLYRDRWFVICEKPAGISSESPGLPDLLGEQLSVKLWPVHRLDLGTGGVCILAQSAEACAALQHLFQQGLVRKEYLAVVSGCPDTEEGIFEDLLFHDQKTNKTFIVKQKRKNVKEASCAWRVVGTVSAEGQPLSLVCVTLHTGRTHQIRVQFASRGLPLAGDCRYGSRIRARAPALWARSVCFPHPYRTDRAVTVQSAPPRVFPWNAFPDA